MEDDTFKHILQGKQFHLQIKAEQKEIIQKCVAKKRFNGSVINGLRLRKEHVLRPPLFGQGTRSYGYL